jgi:ABC-type antimicrobial peptide transport system permease subunit
MSIRAAVAAVDANQPVVRMASMSDLLDETTADRRFALLVFGVFGGVALVLSVTGLYSALARSVTERTREIGVRSALGASRGEILSMVLRQGLALALAGVSAGIVGAVAVTRLLETLLFGTEPTDPLTYAAAALLFMAVAAMASSVPALRAATIDPAITLRAE